MKYLLIAAFVLIFSQNIYADEAVANVEMTDNSNIPQSDETVVSELDENSGSGISLENEFESTNIEFSTVSYYETADSPDYKAKKRVLIGGIVPFIPIRSTIDKSVEDPGLVQKSVSFLLYFKQNF